MKNLDRGSNKRYLVLFRFTAVDFAGIGKRKRKSKYPADF
jgi:hypothetical protein